MEIAFPCPNCALSLRMGAEHAGSPASCASCGQEFIVGLPDKVLPLVQPTAFSESGGEETVMAIPARPGSHMGDAVPGESSMSRTRSGRAPRLAAEPMMEPMMEPKLRRKCGACGSLMYESEYVSPKSFTLGLSDVTEWHCQKCGREIKVAGARRLLLAMLGCPMIALWWFLFSGTSPFRDPAPSWWAELLAQVSPKTSTGAFWYIAFLLLFALAPIELLRQIVIRLRNPRVKGV